MTNDTDAYVPTTAQLVVEVFARDIEVSKRFYTRLGFALAEDRGDFVTLTWEGHQLYLDAHPNQPEVPKEPQANMRIMVPNVDDYWQIAQDLGSTHRSSDRGQRIWSARLHHLRSGWIRIALRNVAQNRKMRSANTIATTRQAGSSPECFVERSEDGTRGP